jgi:hypothetical protein
MVSKRYVTWSNSNRNDLNNTEKQKINVTEAMNQTVSKKGIGLKYGITMIDRVYKQIMASIDCCV